MTVSFAACRLDTAARRLFRRSREVHLSPKAFELLTLLVERRPRALSKAELLEGVWPGVFVSDASLARTVNELRAGLGDRARRRIVRTVHGYGYAFAADVEDEEPAPIAVPGGQPPRWWLTCGTREFGLPDGEHVIGRAPGVTVRLDSPNVSRRHARLVVRGARATIEDLRSKNGTFVRGARITSPAQLEPGLTVRIGPFGLIFGVAGAAGSTETEVTMSKSLVSTTSAKPADRCSKPATLRN